jgi:Cu2+-exporting ATPase
VLGRVRCAACLWLIEERLRGLPGVTRADVNYTTQRAQVAWDPALTRLAHIVDAVREVGYDAFPYDPALAVAQERVERRAALWRLFVAGFGAMQVMMYAFPAYVGDGTLSADAAQLMRWAALLLTLPVMLVSCRPFFSGAVQELRQGRIGLDTPVALGLAGGFGASAWATVSGTGEVYFDSICMLAFLLLGARYLEGSARRRAARFLDPLLRAGSARRLVPGEIVVVAPGETVPADGMVVAGASSADESLLTGESRALAKRAGDELIGGSVNLEQPLRMRVTRVGADTRAAGIARLAERGAASRPRLVDAAERAARHLTWIIIVAAAAAGAWSRDLWVAIAVLVVACPCALALAAPVVLSRAGGALLARGALLTRARSLGALERATDVVLDKTGTLTTGRLSCARARPLGALIADECLELAGRLEAGSRHPIAGAFAIKDAAVLEDAVHEHGGGIEASVDGRRVRIGSQRFCRELCRRALPAGALDGDIERTRVFLADERGWLAAFELDDELRPDAPDLVRKLREENLTLHLASGDSPHAVAAVARRLGIEHWRGGLSPQDKLHRIERLQAFGRTVVMIGDGLNDAPVLARADASFAMGGGADAARLQADIVLLGNALGAVVAARRIARRAMRLVRQNIGWALAYNAVALPLAAAGFIGPWEAALAMGASSLTVLLNALRPLDPDPAWKASTSSSLSPSPSYS